MRAALYTRVSTTEQAINGLSIEAQTEELDRWAEQNHATVVDHYSDPGISARKPASKRPGLQRLLRDAQAGKIDVIVFTRLDRWFRNVGEYHKVQEVLEKYHVSWIALQEKYDTSTAEGMFVVNVMLSAAQVEADHDRERVNAVFSAMKNKGLSTNGWAVPGMKIVDKKLTIDPEMAWFPKEIFSSYIRLQSIHALRLYMRDTYGIMHADQTYRKLLSNKRYIGIMENGAQVCDPVVSVEDFMLVQSILAHRAQRNAAKTSRVYLFSGLCRCADCGGYVGTHTSDHRGVPYIYYYCRDRQFRRCCNNKTTREEALEKYLLDRLLLKCVEYNARAEEKEVKPSIDKTAIRRKLEKLKDLYLNDLIDKDMYESDYRELRKLLDTPDEPQSRSVDIPAMESALGLYDTLTRQQKKEFWVRTISQITLSHTGEISFTLLLS